jgi:hypothetical protein
VSQHPKLNGGGHTAQKKREQQTESEINSSTLIASEFAKGMHPTFSFWGPFSFAMLGSAR